jgi:hypothetical protein
VERGAARRRSALRWLAGALALAFAVKLGFVLFALDRGFELGDEGYTLLNLNHPRDAPAVFQYYRLLNPTGDATRFGVVGARLLRLAAELLGSAALLAGVCAWARAKLFANGRALGFPIVAFASLGALLSTASRSLTYNDVTNFCSYCALGALFLALAQPAGRDGSRVRILAALAAGFANGLQLGVKFPTALLLPLVAAAAFAIGRRALAPREPWKIAGAYALGGGVAVAFYVATGGGVGPLLAELRLMPEIASKSVGYDPIGLVGFYAKGEIVTAIHAIVLAVAFGTSFALLRRLFVDEVDRALAAALASGVLVLAAGVQMLHPFFLHPTLVFLSAFLAFAVPLLGVLAWRLRRGDPLRAEVLAPLALLVALPLVEIAGTDVPISQRLATHALPLFAALGLLALDLRECAGYSRLHAVVAVVLLAATGAIFVRHQVVAPYGLPQGIVRQTEAVEGLPGVRVDAATKSFLESVAAHMREGGFRPGDPVLALDFMPGLVFYLGGTSPGFTLYVVDSPRLNCFNVNRLYHAPPYLILGRPMSIEQAACLEAFAFPDDFRTIGNVRFPYEAAYEDFGAPGFSYVHLFAPRR